MEKQIRLSTRPYESCQNIQGLAPQRCPFGAGTTVVQIISPHDGRLKMKNPTGLSNKTSTA